MSNVEKHSCESLRSLNLSYNTLDFDSNSRFLDYSETTLLGLVTFLNEAKKLTHINLSGMNFDKDQIKLIA